MNQLPLQRRIVRQTLPNLMLFAAPNLTCRTKLIQIINATLLPYLTQLRLERVLESGRALKK